MRTERNSANSLRVNYDRIRKLEKQVEAELRKLATITNNVTNENIHAADKAAYRIELRVGKLHQQINDETAKSVKSGK